MVSLNIDGHSEIKNETTGESIYVETRLIEDENGWYMAVKALEAMVQAIKCIKIYNKNKHLPVARIVLSDCSTSLPKTVDLKEVEWELKHTKKMYKKAKTALEDAIENPYMKFI